jgi:tryptophanase
MANVRFFTGEHLPLDMHRVRIVQKLSLLPIERRLEAITEAGNNTFLLQNCHVFLDMLTDSGVNAMSDQQMAAMMVADDSYTRSATFTRLKDELTEIFGMPYFLPAHQGRACEHILASTLVKPGKVVRMNFHSTTTKAHIARNGGSVVELVIDEGLNPTSTFPFKGNFDLNKLRQVIAEQGAENIPFVRLEAGTNLIGGQPFSLQNAREVAAIFRSHGILTVLHASLLQDNLYFIKQREAACEDMSIREITCALVDEMDVVHFSARKLGFAKGGGICIRDGALNARMRELMPLFEGFLTYGMSVREMEAIAVGLDETMDERTDPRVLDIRL